MTRRLAGAMVLLTAGLAGSAAAQPKIIEIPAERMPVMPQPPPFQWEEIRQRIKEELDLSAVQLDTRKEHLKAAEAFHAAAVKRHDAADAAGKAAVAGAALSQASSPPLGVVLPDGGAPPSLTRPLPVTVPQSRGPAPVTLPAAVSGPAAITPLGGVQPVAQVNFPNPQF